MHQSSPLSTPPSTDRVVVVAAQAPIACQRGLARERATRRGARDSVAWTGRGDRSLVGQLVEDVLGRPFQPPSAPNDIGRSVGAEPQIQQQVDVEHHDKAAHELDHAGRIVNDASSPLSPMHEPVART
jgi:hypothetical protein